MLIKINILVGHAVEYVMISDNEWKINFHIYYSFVTKKNLVTI